QDLAPPTAVAPAPAPAAAPKGPMLQSLPPATSPGPANAVPGGSVVPSGQVALALSARFGRDLPVISSGLHWRIFPGRPDPNGGFRLIKEDHGATPALTLPAGSYVVNVSFGLASASKAVNLRA